MNIDFYKPAVGRKFVAGSTQYLEIDSAPVTGVPFSTFLRFNTEDLTNVQAAFFLGDLDVTADYFAIMLRGDVAGDPVYCTTRSAAAGSVNAVTTTGFMSGRWHSVLAVQATTALRWVTLDGEGYGEETTTVTPTIDTPRISIGRLGDSTPSDYASSIFAQVCLWNVALSRAEGSRMAAGEHPSTIRPESIVALWDFEGTEKEKNVQLWRPLNYILTNTNGSVPVTCVPPKFWKKIASISPWPAAAAPGGAIPHNVFGKMLSGPFGGAI